MSAFRPVILIPCYNHGKTVPALLDALERAGHSVLIVDDGSEPETARILKEEGQRDSVEVITLPENGGKGAAVMAGFRKAAERDFTHAVQVDADGQHDVDALPELLALSKKHPTDLVSGKPRYDESVPKARHYGRYVTHVWVWIETLSLNLVDSMCGFRSYPLCQTLASIDRRAPGSGMDFDTEIMVRMYWAGCNVRFMEVGVIYPEDGISHFDVRRDNIRITLMHPRLFFGMLPRIPKLVARNLKRKVHWASYAEKGSVLGMKTLLAAYSVFGLRVFDVLLNGVMVFYYGSRGYARSASKEYLTQLKAYADEQGQQLPDGLTSFQHFISFGRSMLDKIAGWRGGWSMENVTVHGLETYLPYAEKKQGVIVLGAHLGNLELFRALSVQCPELKINALVFTENAERFNAIMKAVNPASELNLIQVNDMRPEVAIQLKQKLDAGEMVVVMGDRTSVSKEKRVVYADFLGRPAPFPQGAFILASTLDAPTFLFFGLRSGTKYRPHFELYIEPFRESLKLDRKRRMEALQEMVQAYAKRLNYYVMKAPLQWYNFFNFWELSDGDNDE
jgi:predicted LPLAT superfamily acyltransferase